MMLVSATAFLQPHHSLGEETWSRGFPLCFHTANGESVTSGIGVEVPKDSKNALQECAPACTAFGLGIRSPLNKTFDCSFDKRQDSLVKKSGNLGVPPSW